MHTYEEDTIRRAVVSLAKQKEAIILEQLGDLIKRDLLVIEEGPMSLFESQDQPYKLEMRQSVRLTLKNIEYVEKLEKENKELKARLEAIRNSLNTDLSLRNS